jgi:hypothetical protein
VSSLAKKPFLSEANFLWGEVRVSVVVVTLARCRQCDGRHKASVPAFPEYCVLWIRYFLLMHAYIHTHVHTYAHTYVHTYVNTCIYIHTYTRMYIHVCTYICTYIMYICMYMHTYVHTQKRFHSIFNSSVQHYR